MFDSHSYTDLILRPPDKNGNSVFASKNNEGIDKIKLDYGQVHLFIQKNGES